MWIIVVVLLGVIWGGLVSLGVKWYGGLIAGGVAAALVVIIISSLNGMRQVGFDQTCAVTRLGGLTGKVLQPGLNFVGSFVESTVCYTTVVKSYETSDQPNQSKADFRGFTVTGQTSDGQQVTITSTTLFKAGSDSAGKIAVCFGYDYNAVVENLIKAHTRNLVHTDIQNYPAATLYNGTGIVEYQESVKTKLAAIIAEQGCGVTLTDFLIRKVGFDVDYTQSMENKQIAFEGIKTAEYTSQQAIFQGQAQVTLSKAEAEKKVIQAEADASVTKIGADAQAYSINQTGAALNANPKVIDYTFVLQLKNVQWGFLPSGSIPFVNANPSNLGVPAPTVP
jgi:regulator of protease activity HflC (stomatin/prohibitin superfamily)